MNVTFHPLADRELIQAIEFYDGRAPGLGTEFLEEVEAAAARVAENPDAGAPMGTRLRRSLLSRFPFSLLYRVIPDGVLVLAVMHHRREPGYWRDRI